MRVRGWGDIAQKRSSVSWYCSCLKLTPINKRLLPYCSEQEKQPEKRPALVTGSLSKVH